MPAWSQAAWQEKGFACEPFFFAAKAQAGSGLPADGHYGIGNCIDIAKVKCGHADAPGADRIDAELFAQAVNLGSAQARVGKHAALLGDEAEVLAGSLGL